MTSLRHYNKTVFEFHVSRLSRDRYQFEDALFSLTGTALIADVHAARQFAQKLAVGGRVAPAGDIYAMGLIDEISHRMVAEFRAQVNPYAIAEALAALTQTLGAEAVDTTLRAFCEQFPTVDVYRGRLTVARYLEGTTEGVPNREIALEEMLMLWLENNNPAFARYGDLFSDTGLKQNTAYAAVINGLSAYFETQPPFLNGQNLIQALRAPALAHPDSLEAQLRYIEQHWLSGVPGLRNFRVRMLAGRDVLAEEARLIGRYFGPDGGGGRFGGYDKPRYSESDIKTAIRANYATDPEYEAFTQDRAWMPRLVLLAKNAYVWLDQLSRKYQRDISRLDQVPDEELDMLRAWGITGLWLIGVWERSRASRRIKQMMGAEDAVASAYSLMDYVIAQDLGGPAALESLKARAWQRGIRLGSDMVPNHFGIDSAWVLNKPDYFLSLDHPPYPGYTFNGPDLSDDGRVGIFIEDHYYNRSDAAVVFKRLDKWTGDARYIYHGNDGTAMPWNDTAQLNFLRADVREAVIQTILYVCKQFPIVRFDAAMTLAKRHIQRLWFPIPGTGDGIPSRAGLGVTKEEFDRLMPHEFWREVVDRAAVEAPDTLLLAEAFWMLEGYFVRTLGMHRVYNSAFMHMLRDEDNAKYRYLIKETLEFDPQILKRYVNFMNNPDEKTAVEQFGKGDKYFGVALLMSTLPGLPMFGHGQMEGYTEKYGMEFRRPKLNETPDQGLIDYHARMIFPILHRRYLFSEVERFFLYDFYTADGVVDENVFAFSNQHEDERTLVLYHNRFAETRGFVRVSAAYLAKGEGLRQTTLSEAFGLHPDDKHFLRFRDHVTSNEFVRSSREIAERGLYVELGPYKSHIFLDVREVYDADGSYARVAHELAGRGVPSLDDAIADLVHEPILTPLRALINADALRLLHGSMVLPEQVKRGKVPPIDAALSAQIEQRAAAFLAQAAALSNASADAVDALARATAHDVCDMLRVPAFTRAHPALAGALATAHDAAPLLIWALLHRAGELDGKAGAGERVIAWLDRFALRKPLLEALRGLGMDAGAAAHGLETVRLLLSMPLGELRVAPAGAMIALKRAPRGTVSADKPVVSKKSAPTRQVIRAKTASAKTAPVGTKDAATGKRTPKGKTLAARATTPSKTVRSEPVMAASAPDGYAALFQSAAFRRFVQVNTWEGVEYFNKELFERAVAVLGVAELVLLIDDRTPAAKRDTAAHAARIGARVEALVARAGATGYRVEPPKRLRV